jgi:hypothetical protein
MPAGYPSASTLNDVGGPVLNIAANSTYTGGIAKLRVLFCYWGNSFPLLSGIVPLNSANTYQSQFYPWSQADGIIASGDSSGGNWVPMVIGGTTYLPLLCTPTGGGLYTYEDALPWIADLNATGGATGTAAQAAGYTPTLVPLASSTFTVFP